MREMDISRFRRNCSKVLRELQDSGETLRITKNGKTFVNVVPVPLKSHPSGKVDQNGSATPDPKQTEA